MSKKRTIDAFFGAAGAGTPKPKKPRDISNGFPETSRADAHLDGLETSSNRKGLDDAVSARRSLYNLNTKILCIMADLISYFRDSQPKTLNPLQQS